MKRIKFSLLAVLVSFSVLLGGYSTSKAVEATDNVLFQGENSQSAPICTFDLSTIPAYSGQAYVAVNNNIPFFTDADIIGCSFEEYSELDPLGRCGVCIANVGIDIMPTEERGSIGEVKPSGWNQAKYAGIVDGNYLYNRCHLIGYQLTGENSNIQNLITGTRYLNTEGMLPFENLVTDYVKETNNHVLYRVTPIFVGDNLLANGVLMEAKSVEDNGEGILYCVYCYNVQPGITIDYLTGASCLLPVGIDNNESIAQQDQTTAVKSTSSYVLNRNTKKFHVPYCSSVGQMAERNKKMFEGSREEVIAQGYVPCKRCNP